MDHSLVTTGDNKMLCQFCGEKCLKGDRERKRRWWWKCSTCKVKYLASLQGRIETIYFYTKDLDDANNTDLYIIQLDIKQKTTFIIQYLKHDIKPIKSFDHLVDISPETFHNKLKTYLLFL